MKTFKRAFILSAAVTAAFIQGCGCSSSDNDSGIDPGTPGGTPVLPEDAPRITISGVAAKGLISGGIVNIHPIIEGVLSTTPVGSSTTDSTGSYSVDAAVGDNPFVVRVTANSSTTMKCDLAGGCGGGVTFGQDLSLADTDFNLDAVVPPVTNSTANVNLSMLTTTATSVALNTLTTTPTTDINAITTAVNNANSSVANRFGVIGSLTSLPVVDLTSPASLANVAQDIIQYNLLSVGVVEALINGDNTATVASAVSSFASQYVADGGLADREEAASTSVTLAEIFAQASTILNAVRTADTGSTLDLNSLQTVINSNQALAESGSTTPSAGTPSDTEGDTDLEKVKAMVAVVRDLEASIGATGVGGDNTITSVTDAFGLQIETAELATSDYVDNVLTALAEVGVAIDDAARVYDANNSATEYQHENGVNVGIDASSGSPVYSVDQDVVVDSMTVIVDVSATNSVEMDETEDAGVSSASLAGGYDVEGSAENSGVSLMLNDGSMISVTSATSASNDSAMTEDVDVAAVSIDADVTLMQKSSSEVTDPVSVDADISVSFTNVTFDGAESSTGGTETATLDIATITLGGTVSNTSGESYSVAFSVNGDASELSFSEVWDANSETSSGETANDYASATANLIFSANLNATVNAARFNFLVDRSGQDDGDATIRVEFDGNTLIIALDVTDGEYVGTTTITNQDGIVLSVTESNDTISGNIVLNDTEYATVSDDGVVLTITYSDGTFESI